MAQQTIDIGAAPNDGTGDPLRDAMDKCNDNFTELYTNDALYAQLAAQNIFTALQTIAQASANAGILASTGYSLTGTNATSMISLEGTWNTTGNPTAFLLNITNTASGAGSLLMDLQASAASMFAVNKAGNLTCAGTMQSAGNIQSGGGFNTAFAGGYFKINGSFVIAGTGADGVAQIHANNGVDFSTLQVLSLKTGAPSGGTAQFFKVGSAASVSPTSPNRTIEIEVNGTTYYLAAKTTND